MSSLATSLVEPIREGSFPESASVLSADLDSDAIVELLNSIARAKDELSADLREVSKPYAGGVDEWIAQAKKVQEDIARCKQDAQDIVQEHTRLEKSRAESSEAQRRSQLLSDEIAFTKQLQEQLHSVSDVHQQLQSIEASLSNDDIVEAALAIKNIAPHVAKLSGPRVKSIVSEYRDDLLVKTKTKLDNALMSRVTVRYDGVEGLLSIRDSDTSGTTNTSLTSALVSLEPIDLALEGVVDKIETFALRVLSVKTSRHLLSHNIKEGSFAVNLGERSPSLPQILSFSKDIVSYLHSTLPEQMYSRITTVVGPRFITSLITDWLIPAIPLDLSQVHTLDSLGAEVASLAEFMDAHHWPNAGDLRQWTQHAPRMWITKRKSEALDAVRKAFALSQGSLHQVERVERQKVSDLEPSQEQGPMPAEEPTDDWNTSWDDEEKSEPRSVRPAEAEEDTSGWGFDDDMEDDQHKDGATNGHGEKNENADDAGEAWGWGDDDAEVETRAQTVRSSSQVANGERSNVAAPEGLSQTTELTEYYSITDIPDHLIESIGKDIQDALTLREESHASLQGVPASSGLLGLPALSLAMFRATAPTYYSKNPELGNMNLYNDALYVADKLRHMPTLAGMNDIETDCRAMEKFARSAYAREMDTQRTILGDLLDGVQGFTIPYAEQIEDAIAATGERLRQVHADWAPILSRSALLQSTGALLSSILSKVITDIEEMDDISEAQSQRLGNFCGQLAKLEDLFIARPTEESTDQDAIPMVAVYCANWLRFQYLINILESNLQDIKYLWTEGELSLEFSQEEVVDLIKALFADSSHRKSAIAAIRGHRGSGL